jgi:hypothetical protein
MKKRMCAIVAIAIERPEKGYARATRGNGVYDTDGYRGHLRLGTMSGKQPDGITVELAKHMNVGGLFHEY